MKTDLRVTFNPCALILLFFAAPKMIRPFTNSKKLNLLRNAAYGLMICVLLVVTGLIIYLTVKKSRDAEKDKPVGETQSMRDMQATEPKGVKISDFKADSVINDDESESEDENEEDLLDDDIPSYYGENDKWTETKINKMDFMAIVAKKIDFDKKEDELERQKILDAKAFVEEGVMAPETDITMISHTTTELKIFYIEEKQKLMTRILWKKYNNIYAAKFDPMYGKSITELQKAISKTKEAKQNIQEKIEGSKSPGGIVDGERIEESAFESDVRTVIRSKKLDTKKLLNLNKYYDSEIFIWTQMLNFHREVEKMYNQDKEQVKSPESSKKPDSPKTPESGKTLKDIAEEETTLSSEEENSSLQEVVYTLEALVDFGLMEKLVSKKITALIKEQRTLEETMAEIKGLVNERHEKKKKVNE